MSDKVVKIGNVDFKICYDEDFLRKGIENLKKEFEEDVYVSYGKSSEFGDECLTKEEYLANVDRFLSDLESSLTDEKLEYYIQNHPKKKNGKFNRRNIQEIASCENCVYICEWHNTWIYELLKIVASDETTLQIELYTKTDTPG